MNPHSTQINSTTESKSNKRMHLALAVGDANQSLPFDDGYRHSYKSPPPSVQEQVFLEAQEQHRNRQEQLAQLRANGVPTSAYEAFKLGQKKLREGGAITEAINAFKSGLEFDPNHEECKDGLKVAQQIRDHQTRHVPNATPKPYVSDLYPSLSDLDEYADHFPTYSQESGRSFDEEEDSEEGYNVFEAFEDSEVFEDLEVFESCEDSDQSFDATEGDEERIVGPEPENLHGDTYVESPDTHPVQLPTPSRGSSMIAKNPHTLGSLQDMAESVNALVVVLLAIGGIGALAVVCRAIKRSRRSQAIASGE